MSVKMTALMFTLALAGSQATTAALVDPPAVPANLVVPGGLQPYMLAHAEGTQNYMCVVGPSGFAWTFFGPQAMLSDATGGQLMTHFLSPNRDESGAARATWLSSGDSTAIWGAAIASSTDAAFVAPGAIPWLLLRVVGDEDGPAGPGALTGTQYIQRINTAGGTAPAGGCKAAADVGKKALVPYTTDYVFYR
jgi:Protein of unknown function (DUF3455)